MKNKQDELMLGQLQALDLTDEKGYICGHLLGVLGVDVIKVEPPGGDAARNIGPFYHNIPDSEKSLYWFAYNLNKRGITLNIETADGQEIFKRLCKKADFVIESFPAGYMDGLGLGYSTLSAINPRIIMTSITPFGQTGPYKDYKASDIVGMAMGGLMMYTTGEPDRPPLRISLPQAYLNAGVGAAMSTMVAHYHRDATGEGQHVDTSMQACMAVIGDNLIPMWQLKKLNAHRAGSFMTARTEGGANQRLVWACKDGYVLFILIGGGTGIKTNRAITEWINSEGMAPDYLLQINWDLFDPGSQTQELQQRLEEPIAKFFASHTKAELYEGAIKRGIMLYPVSDIKDVVENSQLRSRDFWIQVEHPELNDTIIYPGFPAKFSETPCRVRFRAPLIGEHNQEIYQVDVGLSQEEITILKQAGII